MSLICAALKRSSVVALPSTLPWCWKNPPPLEKSTTSRPGMSTVPPDAASAGLEGAGGEAGGLVTWARVLTLKGNEAKIAAAKRAAPGGFVRLEIIEL